VNSPSSKIVLITGASSGIGEATARRLAADGHHVVLGARRVDRLAVLVEQLRRAGGTADLKELDVTSRDSVRFFVEDAQERNGRIDVLINNAGVMALSALDALRVDEWDRMIDVNLRGTMYGIAAALPIMRKRGTGHIINIASSSAYRVDPTAAIYCATKYAVRALTEGLRQESRDIRVTLVSPGYTHSELTEHGGDPDVQAAVRTATGELGMSASAVADAIAYAIAQPDTVDVNEIIMRSTRQG
jgi:NADP-dependent 3-hydroxy acid dehydrogenase YdfG